MSTTTDLSREQPARVEPVERVVIRFAGDSGDGMQLTGTQFSHTSALLGNDLSTFPDFPAEIRAPAGSLPGVSGFQVHFSSTDITTPGDAPDVLVAMNPAALKVNIADLKPNGILIVNTTAFRGKNLEYAGYTTNPLEDHSLDAYRVFKVDLTTLTRRALAETSLSQKEIDRCKNFFALGMMYWLYNRPMDATIRFIDKQFAKKPELGAANKLALQGGYSYCAATEVFQTTYEVAPAKLPPGKYRSINGNSALALGLVAASEKTGLPLFLGSYPITPASDILHELSLYKNFGVLTFQAEDEIAAVTSAIGASFAGALGVTTSSGPGMALKSEALGLAVMTEIPLVAIDIQRGGPSTGLPTKTEQADLFQAVFGRNSEAPIPVIAPATAGDCFFMAMEACRIATKYMTPVILLSDGYLANGSEPWKIPSMDQLPSMKVEFHTDPSNFKAYRRNPATLGRMWAVPGTPGLEHRLGGIEKEDVTGNISYDPLNHEHMVRLRAAKVAGIAKDIPDLEVDGPSSGDLLVLGWGSTHGAIMGAVEEARRQGLKVSRAHLRYLNPFPKNLQEVLGRFRKVLVPEMNMGQLAFVLRGTFLIDIVSYPKIQGKPFKIAEIVTKIREVLEAR
jgi:2-oxoglutarate/2-oxoacid ferredoxin oxidoreductase subunit alpha